MGQKLCISKKIANITFVTIFFFFSFWIYLIVSKSLLQTKVKLQSKAMFSGSQTKIVGGQDAKKGEWPFMVSIFDRRNFTFPASKYHRTPYSAQEMYKIPDTVAKSDCVNRNGKCISNVYPRSYCGGVLIDRLWVLTASHCLERYDESGNPYQLPPSEIGLGIGMWDLKNDIFDYKTTFLSEAEEVFFHDYHLPGNYVDRDIALIKLKNPVDLPTISYSSSSTEYEIGQSAVILGWGSNGPEQYILSENVVTYLTVHPPILQKATLTIIDPNKAIPTIEPAYLQFDHIITDSTTAGPFSGDSGGPILVFSRSLNKYVVVGISSFVLGSSSTDETSKITTESMFPPHHYTNLKNYGRWIEKTTSSFMKSGVKPLSGTFIGNPDSIN